ncbi:transglutaminase-like cysteine peptidase [Lichenihabitans sp. Uapishka_5]|uniref:transglutaminase-like cysteine peptidase n=1 Tax=Lichenihabitans sp. Uapishka_5 TaxID=3037302 RepID=UPI0029E80F4D|nr:transglutaminase-like cysteine peptidase [Lichenihabitans sp. Uapishka_5]MDX7950875.1 transglutaminase-like cysteine peptidase [Lichenihabitans sp. Uapishka_5]
MSGSHWQGWTAALVALVLSCGLAAAQAGTPFMQTTGITSVPYGWVDFCNRYAGECDGPTLVPVTIPPTAATLRDLDQVNRSVNSSVTSVTDMEHWGVVDRWDYPLDGKGDCEDYVLMKRKVLMDRGLPRQALLVTVVKDHAGEGHAVLTVKTGKGDLVLDNMTDKVMRWDETGYRFIKRQSGEDQNRWVSIGTPEPGPLFTAK